VHTRPLRIGTRTSPLALKQVDEVVGRLRVFYPGITVEICGIDTCGDKDKTTPISAIEGTDFFTREIEDALLQGQIDCAVHSAKDLPDKIPDGLYITAVTGSLDPYDVLISKKKRRLEELPSGAKIGASSERRKRQLRLYRDDFKILDVRGTIGDRLKKLDETGLDAIVLAACGLMRLGLEERIAQRIPFEILRPHPLQGSLALEVREEDRDLIALFSRIDSRESLPA
jgi:hydroxymethylbilane synthase